MLTMLAETTVRPEFNGFHGLSFVLLVGAGIAAVAWLIIFATLWISSFPRLPGAGPATTDFPPEPPAIANLLVHRWRLSRSALPATLIDLAARRILSIQQLDEHHFVIRLGLPPTEKLLPYEQQVLDHVKQRATGGSAPLEAIGMDDEGDATRFWHKFRDRVISDARKRRLARNRWRPSEITLLGVILGVAFGLVALAFGNAHLGSTWTDDGFDTGTWAYAAGAAWIAVMALLRKSQDLRDTPAGRAAAARWLGVRKALRDTHAFEDALLASVIIWERNLSYAAALGVARDAVRVLPFEGDDPHTAWSRYTGSWREVDIHYPERFGFGEAPFKVFFGGLWRIAVFGGLAFVALPVVSRIIFDLADSVTTAQEQSRGMAIFVAAFGAAFAGAALYLGIRLMAGLIRFWRGLVDLGKSRTIEGQIVKVHGGRVAVDDGTHDELVAWIPRPGVASGSLGAKVRVTVTPHLWHVLGVEVLSRPAPMPAVADEAADVTAVRQPGFIANALGMVAPMVAGVAAPVLALDAAAVSAATSLQLHEVAPETKDDARAEAFGAARQAFSDGSGNNLRVILFNLPPGPAGAAMSLMIRKGGQKHEALGIGEDAWWVRGQDLIVHQGTAMLTVEADLRQASEDTKREAAISVARLVLERGSATVTPGAPASTQPSPAPGSAP